MQDALKAVPAADVRVLCVWAAGLGADVRDRAEAASRQLTDPRFRQFWIGDPATARAVVQAFGLDLTLPGSDRMRTFDDGLLFRRSARWEATAPTFTPLAMPVEAETDLLGKIRALGE